MKLFLKILVTPIFLPVIVVGIALLMIPMYFILMFNDKVRIDLIGR